LLPLFCEVFNRKLLMMEFSLVDPVNCVGLLGGAKKLQKGNPGGESGQPMLFECLLGQASHIPTKGAEKMSLTSPLSDKEKNSFSIKEKKFLFVKAHNGEFPKDGNKTAQRGFFNIDSKNNISIPGNEKLEKTNKSLLGMVNLLSEKSGQKQALGEVKNLLNTGLKEIKGAIPVDGSGKTSIKNILKNSVYRVEETIVENGKTGVKELIDNKMKILHNEKPEKTNKSLPGMVNSLSEKSGQKQALGEVKNLLKAGFKVSRVEVPKDGSGKTSIKNILKNSVYRVEETIVENGKTGVKELIDNKMKILHNEKPEKTNKSLPGMVNSLSEKSGQKQALGGGKNLLKAGFKASRVEVPKDGSDKTSIKHLLNKGLKEINGAIPVDGNGKTSIKNILKNSVYRVEETIVENGKTGVKELIDNKMKILNNEISQSPPLPDKIFSVGEHHHTSIHGGRRTGSVNGRVDSYGIEPRTLINQVAKGMNRPGRVKIALTPPHLGTLDMDVIVRKNKVYVILQAENNDVKQILQSNVETLKSALRSQGLIADNISVSVQERSDSAGHFGFGRNETLLKEHNNQKENKEYPGRKRDSMDYAHSSLDEETPHVRSDGHISLFA
jgi:flagellar hook-length control protein FliK